MACCAPCPPSRSRSPCATPRRPPVSPRAAWLSVPPTTTTRPACAPRSPLRTGTFTGNATSAATLATATRIDYAEAVVAVLTGDGHIGKVYELAGDVEWSYPDLAAELSRQTRKQIGYRQLTADEQEKDLVE